MSSVLVSGSGITQVTGAGGTGPVHVEQTLRLVDNMNHADAAAAGRAGWGVPTEAAWAYTSGPGFMSGVRCMRLASSGNNGYCPYFTTGTTTWFYFQWACQNYSAGPDILQLQDSTGTALGVSAGVLSTGALRMTSNGNNTDSAAGAITLNTAYHVMFRYTVSSSWQMWLSTTGTFDENPNFSRGAGATNNASRIRFRAGASNAQVFTKLRVATVRFGNSPL